MRPLISTVALVLLPALANADVPTCDGNDPQAAKAAMERARGLFKVAVSDDGSQSPDARRSAQEAALAAVDDACRAGDTNALWRRAIILAAMGRWVDAARSLESFDKVADLAALSTADQDKLGMLRLSTRAKVATLRIHAPVGAKISIDGVAVEADSAVIVMPGARRVLIEDGSGRHERLVTVEAGAAQDVETGEAVSDRSTLASTFEATARATARPNLLPWVIGLGAGALAMGGVGIGSALWADERARTFNAFQCASSAPAAGCGAVRSEYDAARGVEVTGFIGAGVLAVAAGVLLVLELRSHRRSMTALAW